MQDNASDLSLRTSSTHASISPLPPSLDNTDGKDLGLFGGPPTGTGAPGDVRLGGGGLTHASVGGFPLFPTVASAPDSAYTPPSGYAAAVFCLADSRLYVNAAGIWIKTAVLS